MDDSMERATHAPVITLTDRIEHYDHADLQNPYNFANLYVPAAQRLGYKFRVAPLTPEEDHPKIEATPETISKIDEIGEQLRLRGVVDIYLAVDDGDLGIDQALNELGKIPPMAVHNPDFLKKCYLLAYERRVEKATREGPDIDKPTMPTEYETERYHQIKFSLRDKSPLNHEDMIEELSKAMNEVLMKYPNLKP